MSRVEELKARISAAAESYWNFGISAISDTEYDALVEELKVLTGEEDSIGVPEVLSSGKVKHPAPMLSMQKVYDMAKVVDWVRKYAGDSAILAMPKYDGIALVKYPDGTVATRGDSEVGENVTAIAKVFMAGAQPGYGECVCPLDEFGKIKSLGYKNPRNAVSGIMSSKDDDIQFRSVYLRFVPYHHIMVEVAPALWRRDDNASFRDERECRNLKQKLSEAADVVRSLAKNYPMDGVVFRIADRALFEKLGRTDHHWRGQIALKSANESAESVIKRIDWQEKNGTITPVASIVPVTLGGAEISRTTLHNAGRVIDWDIRPGDHCRIERAGGVIPKLVETWHGENSAPNPTRYPVGCPSCGTPLREKGARLYCPRCDK